jgi:undecaprenyl pyrophosphate phosphatase UppP
MKNFFKWLVWITAVFLAFLMTILQFSFAVADNEQKRLTVFRIVLSIIVGVLSQLGLFFSPWALKWKHGYQKIVVVLMIPSILWLLSELLKDFKEFIGFDKDFLEHGVEAIVITIFLVIYSVQIFKVSIDFMKQPRLDTQS